ncbi:MAG: spore coat protein [Firmicutes bacterium]|nr:spore coat protein [Bacillota bacterium]
MAYTHDLAVHEKLELHELLTFKTVCAAKASMMQNQVQDAQLKGLLNQDISNARIQIQELQGLLQGTMQ